MKIEYLNKMDRIIKKAGSRDPDDVLEYMGYEYIDPGDSIPGFITRRKNIVYYGVSMNMSEAKYAFGSFHEAFHGICGHLDIPGFIGNGMHTDSFSDNRHFVAWMENDANIGAADVLIETPVFLEMTGYDNNDVLGYLKSVESFDKAVEDYKSHYEYVVTRNSSEQRIRRMNAYRRELDRMYRELQEQAQDISNSGCCMTGSQIAREFGVPEYIIDYKYKAMEVRNYDIPKIEMPSFDKVFSQW